MRTQLLMGTLFGSAAVVAAATALVSRATARLHAQTDEEVRALYRGLDESAPLVSASDLAPLPRPVQRWLWRSGVLGQPRAHAVRLKQSGEMHTSAGAAWFPIEAEEYFTIAEPSFIWWMEGRMAKLLPLAGRDELVGGVGELRMAIGGFANVAHGRGPKIDQGALLRWLAEIMWFPSAALSPCIAWDAIDDLHARATVTSSATTATGIFTFDVEGRVAAFEAERWFGADGPLEHWAGRGTAWETIRGIEIPIRGEVTWHLKTGDFTFFRWRIDDVETNRPSPYRDDPPR